MKKKIIATLFTVTLATSAFLMGHATTATEKTMISVEDITDWNTNGKELSLMLSDDTEVYAYKSSNVSILSRRSRDVKVSERICKEKFIL